MCVITIDNIIIKYPFQNCLKILREALKKRNKKIRPNYTANTDFTYNVLIYYNLINITRRSSELTKSLDFARQAIFKFFLSYLYLKIIQRYIILEMYFGVVNPLHSEGITSAVFVHDPTLYLQAYSRIIRFTQLTI